jgi:hypothetical protein
MREKWRPISGFPEYSVSNFGNIRSEKSGRILALSDNQYGVQCVGLMKNGEQRHRSVPRLVAQAFLPRGSEVFDTPINLDGDRHNNHVDNLAWRPRWFAVKYNRQFREPFETAKRFGLLEQDVVVSILENTLVWPTYQRFRIVED